MRSPGIRDKPPRLVMVAALVLATVGWIMRTWSGKESIGLGMIITGILLLMGAFWWVGRQIPHTNYQNESWRFGDVIILGGICLLGLALFFPFEWIDRASLYYSAYPLLEWPHFDPWIGTALLALSLPAYEIGRGKS